MTNENGYVEFLNLPKVDKNGAVIAYDLREDAHTPNSPKATDRTEIDIVKKHESGTTPPNLTTTQTFTDGDRHYNYTGTAEYVAAAETIGGTSKTYATEYHITNTLPLTYIQVNKAWVHSDSMYSADMNRYRKQDVTFTLTRKGTGDTAYRNFNDTTSVADQKITSANVKYSSSMSAVFEKLPAYDNSNNLYQYKVTETDIKGYNTSYLYTYTVDSQQKTTTDGTIPSKETTSDAPLTMTVTNTQITGEAEVIKIDQTHYDAYSTHISGLYTDIVLSGAKFELTYNAGTDAQPNYTPLYVVKNSDGKYVPDKDYATNPSRSNIVESGADGKIRFAELPMNTYCLTEIGNVQGFLPRGESSYFRVDAESASAATATAYYGSGFVQGNETAKNRIGNLQRIEEVTVTLVKMDAADKTIRLPNTTYYLLQMIPYEMHQNGSYSGETEYNAAADEVLKNCNGILTEEVRKFWNTDRVQGDHIPYVYRTDNNGMIGPIKNIMNGRYAFLEVQAPEGYERSFCEPFTITSSNKVVHVEHFDPRKTGNVSILKEDHYHNTLEGGIFELYYKPQVNTAPPTYTINSPVTPPTPSVTISDDSLSVPAPEPVTTPTQKVTYQYHALENLPTNEPSVWVLPRTDNDYIFFEDVDCYSQNKWHWKDGTKIVERYGADYRNLTIGELDNEPKVDIVAEFNSGDNGTGEFIGKYKVWERFVYYNESGPVWNNGTGHTQNVIWKIQPPDGAKSVRFILGWGDDSNSTNYFNFTKGNLYRRGGNGKVNAVTYNINQWSSPTANVWDNIGANGTMPPEAAAYTRTAGHSGVAYEAMPQKIIFRRNSHYCWDNIHIEFFKKTGTAESPEYTQIGEKFPGYLMEPYAYAKDNYRIDFSNNKVENDGDLCYEIAIPVGATHFRVNNGTTATHDSGTYHNYGYYYTAITPIDLTSTNKKNYNNYWKIADGTANNGTGTSTTDNRKFTQNVQLVKWTDSEITTGNGTIRDSVYDTNATAFEVASDHDFIYFTKPASWQNVYAYFYGGGDLRADNWQRACWSIWPGVLSFNSELYGNNTKQDPTLALSGSDNTFNTYINSVLQQPGSTYKNKYGETVYKFKRPLGDTTNYYKVIFSNGLVGAGTDKTTFSGKETNVIEYTLGSGYYAYDANAAKTATGSWTQQQSNSTIPYTFRKSDGKVDYLYIKNNTSNSWDDIHVQFYSGNTQILQQNHGYVMAYSGKRNDNREWYKVPVPTNASHFTLSNGYNKSGGSVNNEKSTDKYPILAYDANPTSSGYTKTGDMVYQISDAPASGTKYTLSLSSPTVERVVDTTQTVNEQVSDADYITRGDKLHIVDMQGNWSLDYPVQVRFYHGSTQITGSSNANGVYHGIMSQADTNPDYSDKHWWSLDIPAEADSFTINNGAHYPIYPKTVKNSGAEGTTFTTGNMYYKTTSNTTAEVIWPTFTASNSTGTGIGNYDQRGDSLYLVCKDDSGRSWNDMFVTFYSDDNGTQEINEPLQMKYLGALSFAVDGAIPEAGVTTNVPEAVGHWYKAAIPYTAKSFKVSNDASSPFKMLDKAYPIYTKRSKTSLYLNNYTLDGMQYRISDVPASDPQYTLGLASDYNDGKPFYPQFTENGAYEWTEGENVPKDDTEPITIDPTIVAEYKSAPVVPAPVSSAAAPSDIPVLYETGTVSSNQTVTLRWTESNYYNYLRFVPSGWWKNDDNQPIKAHFSGGTQETSWPGIEMFNTGEVWTNGNPVYAVKIPEGNNTKVTFTVKNYADNAEKYKSNDCTFPDYRMYGNGLVYVMENVRDNQQQTVQLSETYDTHISAPDIVQDDKIRFKNVKNWTSPIYVSFDDNPSVEMTDEGSNIWSIDVPNGATSVEFTSGGNTTGSITLDNSNSNGKTTWDLISRFQFIGFARFRRCYVY